MKCLALLLPILLAACVDVTAPVVPQPIVIVITVEGGRPPVRCARTDTIVVVEPPRPTPPQDSLAHAHADSGVVIGEEFYSGRPLSEVSKCR